MITMTTLSRIKEKKKIIRNDEKGIQKTRFIIQSLVCFTMYLDWSRILFIQSILRN